MISKELLSEVLPDTKTRKYTIERVSVYEHWLGNIDVLSPLDVAHRCKEWALSEGIEHNITSKSHTDCYTVWISKFVGDDYKVFQAKTEPEAVFKACQWILENKESK